MIRVELNNRTEIVDLKAGVLFVQTEKGIYCVYGPDCVLGPEKKVMFGEKCVCLAQEVFNEMVIDKLGQHVLKEKMIDKNGSIVSLKFEDGYYAVDFAERQFVCSENLEEIKEIMKKRILNKGDKISNFETQVMNDEMGNTLVMEAANKEKLYKVIDVYDNIYPSNNLNAAMFDLTRAREALSILKNNKGTIDLTFLNNYKMGPEMLNFRSVNGDSVIIKFKMNGRWEPEEQLSKKELLGVISGILLEVDPDCLKRHLIDLKEEGLTIKPKRSL